MLHNPSDNCLRIFLKDMGHKTFITTDQISDLVKKARSGNEAAKETLIKNYAPMIWGLARRLSVKFGDNFYLLDLIQEGNMTILELIKSFDEKRHKDFTYYVARFADQKVRHFLKTKAKTVKINGAVQTEGKKYFKIQQELDQQLQRDATFEDVAVQAGEEVSRVRSVLQNTFCVFISLNQPLNINRGSECHLDFLVGDDPMTSEQNLEKREYLEGLLRSLEPRERNIIKDVFGLNGYDRPLTFNELSEAYHLSTERIRQIKVAVVKKLRKTAKFNKLLERLK